MHSSSDIHTVTYLSKEYGTCWVDSFGPAETCGGGGFCSSVVNSAGEGGYYVELIGIKGLNWLSKHFINREWIAVRERFIGAVGHLYSD